MNGMTPARFTADDARRIGAEIGIEWASAPFDVEQFRMGLEIELSMERMTPRRTSQMTIRS